MKPTEFVNEVLGKCKNFKILRSAVIKYWRQNNLEDQTTYFDEDCSRYIEYPASLYDIDESAYKRLYKLAHVALEESELPYSNRLFKGGYDSLHWEKINPVVAGNDFQPPATRNKTALMLSILSMPLEMPEKEEWHLPT